MQKIIAILVILFVSLGAANAEPVEASLLTTTGKAGGIVLIKGSGFGEDKKAVKVLFDETPARIVSHRPDRLSVQAPTEAPADCQVTVQVGDMRSEPQDFRYHPSVILTVDKNPLPVGETATGRFTVYHSAKPVSIQFVNESPQVVTFVGGQTQLRRTSGGTNNQFTFEIRGTGGPRLYDVGFKWTFDHNEFESWTLPWGSAGLTEKP